MKKLILGAVAGAIGLACSAATADNPVLRIMPLGDSITYGSCSEGGGGYRFSLWNLLRNAGYNVDYVGTQTNNPRKAGDLPDVDHEGHSGWRLSHATSGVYENIIPWFKKTRDSHVILLHLGTNDSGDSAFPTQGTNNLVRLLDRIHAAQPSAKVIVTTLIPRTDNSTRNTTIETSFNPYVEPIVAAQVAKGQQAYFLDMHDAFSVDGLYTDGLHPKDSGYAMMANAWFGKIQEIFPDPTQCGGANTPTVLSESQSAAYADGTCSITFNQPMNAAQLAAAATWNVTGAASAWTVSAAADARSVTFTFGREDFGKTITIAAPTLETADSADVKWPGSCSFRLERGSGAANNISAATRAGYELVYELAIPSGGTQYRYNNVAYKTDRHLATLPFSRVAYYMELQKPGEDLQYVWVSMDAFTTDPGKIGVPTTQSGAVFQRDVDNLFIESNVSGLRTGRQIAKGNIEFWPNEYSRGNSRGLAGASTSLFDIDDVRSGAGTYYGSMQVHDSELGSDGCVFAWNCWERQSSSTTDIGIGKCTTNPQATDWTQTYNSSGYSVRNMQIYVLPTPAAEPPAVLSAARDAAQRRITVTFSTPVAEGNLANCFALAGGRITGVGRDADNYSVVNIEYVPSAGDLRLTVSGVREASGALLAMTAPVTLPVNHGALPSEITSAVNDPALTANYDVLYQVDIPAAHVNWLTSQSGSVAVPYTVKREDYPANVDRVAYFMELRGNGAHKWVWVSMDAFSPDVRKFGVPVSSDRAVKQQWVKNMDVKSNVGGIVNGVGMDGGFIEFWHMNYNGANALNVPGASASSYDWGDRMDGSGNYGCMQVHNVTNRNVVFAFNNFGANNSDPSCIGIGNDTSNGTQGTVNPDYTFHYTANAYTSRRLWVLVRPGPAQVPAAPPPAKVVEKVPEAAGYSHLYELTLPAANMAARTPASYPTYHTVDNRALFAGAKPSRVAYYLELVKADGTTNWCWTAFNHISDDLARYSLPTGFPLRVQQRVSNLDVRSNVVGVKEVTGSNKGNVEFFPLNYGKGVAAGIPGADGNEYDFDDTPNDTGSYGCMQVHNWGDKQTCWAVGNLNGGTIDCGIGNYSATKTDWTQTNTGNQYTSRKLHVFLKFDTEAGNATPAPSVRRVVASRDRSQLCVEFDREPGAEFDGALYEIATVRTGATVKSVKRSPLDAREYIIELTRPLAAGTSYTLKGFVMRDCGDVAFTKAFSTPAANLGEANLTAANVPELGDYELVNAIDFGSGGVSVTANGANYSVDESRFGVGAFDRIAYFLELEGTNNVTQWVWASMDAFTRDAALIGLPSVQRENFFQQYVENLKVCSGATGATAAAVAGEFARGNIEFFTSNYEQPNTAEVPGASASVFDFGDKPSAAHGRTAGHGCLQIHDYLNGRTVLAINCLNGTPALGIGSDTTATSNGINPDWTHHSNAGAFRARRLRVYVRPATAFTGAAFEREPEDATLDVGAKGQLVASAPGAIGYAWTIDGKVVNGATGPILDLPALAEGAHTVRAFAYFADGSVTAGRETTVTVAWPASFTAKTLRIMPLGDSITHGVVGGGGGYQGGYRKKLWEKLAAANYSVDFVGSQTANSSGMTDTNHEGHSGWKISDPTQGLYENMIGWFKGILNPHVVLMHIGTNDSGDETKFKTAIDRLDALIERIAEAQPGAVIVVSSLLERGGTQNTRINTYFNPFVRERVLAHQLKGRKVTFLDMAAYVPLSDMPDNLHPNEAGYEKMAQGWFDAITAIWPTAADVEPDNTPAILSFDVDQANSRRNTFFFNTPLDAESVTDVANWAIDGAAPQSVALASDKRTVTVTTAQDLESGMAHEITLEGFKDEAKTAALPRTSREFFVSIPQGIERYVPASELAGYEKVYSLEIPAWKVSYASSVVKYAVDNHAAVRPFSRVAYYLELRKPNENLQYVWVSMDAFTDDAGKIGIPTKASGAKFQQRVSNMRVISNVAGVRNGEIPEGNIEFWGNTYTGGAKLGLPGAAGDYDFDDTMTDGNYGSFQVHDFMNGSTIFAYNRWTYGDTAQDLGIGTCPSRGINVSGAGAAGADWTFMLNSDGYEVRHLEVWTQPDVAHTTPPTPVEAMRSSSGRSVVVSFDENLAPNQNFARAFTMSDGTPVAGAELFDYKKVRLTFATPVALEGLQVTVSGLVDASANAVVMPSPVTLDVADGTMPADVAALVGAEETAGYKMMLDLNVPLKTDWVAKGDAMYSFDDTKFFVGNFDRVAYLFELVQGSGATQYVWVAMNPFTTDVRRLGIPLSSKGYYFQKLVSNLDVKSNVSGVANGTGIGQGNIEFWPNDYSQPNAINVPGADAAKYDWGDTRSTGGSYGSFQVHNTSAGQVVFAINNWGSDGKTPCVGIGSQSGRSDGCDWTFAENAGNYLSRRLRVFVRPSDPTLPAPEQVVTDVPDAANFEHLYTVVIPERPKFSDAASNTACHVVNNASALGQIHGAAQPRRVAYYFELEKGDGTRTWAWTAFDNATNNLAALSVPRAGAQIWRKVNNLDVRSNVPGIVQGDGLATGNIEFNPYNYANSRRLNLEGGSASAYDFDDTPNTGGNYGCMQVHNWGAGQTVWAFNNVNGQDGGGVGSVGIGNSSNASYPDWTHQFTANQYVSRKLHVFAQWNSAEWTPPTAAATAQRAIASADRTKVCVSFDNAAPAEQAELANFSCAGLTFTAATISPTEPRDVLLTLAEPAAAGASFTLTVAGVGGGASKNLALKMPTDDVPAVIANVDEAGGYRLVYELAIGVTGSYGVNGAPYLLDESRFAPGTAFDRVAYCLELVGTNGVSTWAWTSMDAFTTDMSKIGLPTAERGVQIQQYVNDLHVRAGASAGTVGVTPGDYARGNIEFWPNNYSEGNSLGIAGASGSAFDWGDKPSEAYAKAGYGSMQVHVTDLGQTAWAVNSFGNGSEPGLGVGTRPANAVGSSSNAGPDWTHVHNARAYSVRNLYVLVRPVAMGAPDEAAFRLQPQSASVVVGGAPVRLTAFADGATEYQWYCDGEPMLGATANWLEVPANKTGHHVYRVLATLASGPVFSLPAEVDVFTRGTMLIFR